MSSRARGILAAYCVSVIVCCIWVPWEFIAKETQCWGGGTYFVGYSPLWASPAPPQIRERVPRLAHVSDGALTGAWPPPVIDGQRIFLELLTLTATFGTALLLAPLKLIGRLRAVASVEWAIWFKKRNATRQPRRSELLEDKIMRILPRGSPEWVKDVVGTMLVGVSLRHLVIAVVIAVFVAVLLSMGWLTWR